ncbi:hypothetical protein CDD80_4639 [Ophiocordyceps camponoti-rufipedis]|uniref:Uncharacterized protein n=1 Tax=Ophiocordyceps camponoti-rufipedis TaxID=2004952 RepID=A0A2C5Y2G3_9HYPO|nr:hypothetical protein CDD80_4639 [Ophiocordyceps camponoti-rufipedis]
MTLQALTLADPSAPPSCLACRAARRPCRPLHPSAQEAGRRLVMFWREHGNDRDAWQSKDGWLARTSALDARARGAQAEISSSTLGQCHETEDDTTTAAATPAEHKVAAIASAVPTAAVLAPAVDPAVVTQFTTSLSALGQFMDRLYFKLDQMEKRFDSEDPTPSETNTATSFVAPLADLTAHPERRQSLFHDFVKYGLAGELPQIVVETLTSEELQGYLLGRRSHHKMMEDGIPSRLMPLSPIYEYMMQSTSTKQKSRI